MALPNQERAAHHGGLLGAVIESADQFLDNAENWQSDKREG
jgi:hypothetical protein